MFRVPLLAGTKRPFAASWSTCLGTAPALLLLGTLVTGPARAGPLFGVTARATAGTTVGNEGKSVLAGGDGHLTANTGPVAVNGNDGFGPNIATAEANARLGKVSAFASAIGADGLAEAEVGVEWFDTITVTSSSAPRGTEVTFKLTLSLFDTIAHTGTVHPGITIGIANVGVGSFILQDDFFNPLAVRTFTTTFTEPVGATFDLRGGASLQAEESNDSSMTVDARDTAQFNLDPITPGAGYTTASGVSYLTSPPAAVPEPASLTLLNIGGLSLLGFRWRWLRQRRTLSVS